MVGWYLQGLFVMKSKNEGRKIINLRYCSSHKLKILFLCLNLVLFASNVNGAEFSTTGSDQDFGSVDQSLNFNLPPQKLESLQNNRSFLVPWASMKSGYFVYAGPDEPMVFVPNFMFLRNEDEDQDICRYCCECCNTCN